ncbi:flagellar basal body rod protein FlgB [Paenibacillus sp. CAA11]|uniref:flagellar basal body rod protein FlgB n=1 Tax=Paenibacillus sp. CAA11 TaxID=1532905 RepID=UPI000D3391EC|nr:flagellar basal body rod protein FlgB [Paenibacillus sp. CAA11]AWB44289.1 flagellar basal body rod protein FlgB [Paenibacillus sp. CAA11]
MQLLNGTTFDKMQTAIQAADTRQRVLANNIANVDTPHFKRENVSFESLLQNELNGATSEIEGKRTDTRHFVIGSTSGQVPQPVVTTDQSTSMNNNMNNVDVDREMSLLAENQLRYNSYIEQVNYRIKMMRTAIEGRG